MTISNPTHGNISVSTAAFSWPELSGLTCYIRLGRFGADQPVGAGAPVGFINSR